MGLEEQCPNLNTVSQLWFFLFCKTHVSYKSNLLIHPGVSFPVFQQHNDIYFWFYPQQLAGPFPWTSYRLFLCLPFHGRLFLPKLCTLQLSLLKSILFLPPRPPASRSFFQFIKIILSSKLVFHSSGCLSLPRAGQATAEILLKQPSILIVNYELSDYGFPRSLFSPFNFSI